MQLTSIRRGFLGSLLLISTSLTLKAQLIKSNSVLTHQDTLRGSINAERNWWDVKRYDIAVRPDFTNKFIKGSVSIGFKVLGAGSIMQIDLQEPMQLNSAYLNGKPLSYKREGNVFHVIVNQSLPPGSMQVVKIDFSGNPVEATRPPWDGGWIWKKDKHGNPWMSVACQGLGASVWYPCKDHQSDEPDKGASLAITTAPDLVGVGNGKLVKEDKNSDGTITWKWEVTNPINNYNIVPYIGKYAHFSDTYKGEKGKLDLNFWVLEENLDSAKKQFTQVKPMLKCFEYWFGPYPFYEDGYKLVESPHLGMEHQSAIAYGNSYKNGYRGKDLSGTGWGLKWDFIIVHESGHEWFGNNITSNDIADMWVHESFTNYSETIYTECQSGKQAGSEYLVGSRKNIKNDIPIVGPYGVNQEGSGDMYPKGANMLHTIRQIMNDDNKFRNMLRSMNKKFYHHTVDGNTIEKYISDYAGIDFSKVFDQYLRTIKIPQFDYQVSNNLLSYRWRNVVDGFNMPIKLLLDDKQVELTPTTGWQTFKTTATTIKVDPNFYVTVKGS